MLRSSRCVVASSCKPDKTQRLTSLDPAVHAAPQIHCTFIQRTLCCVHVQLALGYQVDLCNCQSAAGACREALMRSKYMLAYAPNSLYKQPCHCRQLQGPLGKHSEVFWALRLAFAGLCRPSKQPVLAYERSCGPIHKVSVGTADPPLACRIRLPLADNPAETRCNPVIHSFNSFNLSFGRRLTKRGVTAQYVSTQSRSASCSRPHTGAAAYGVACACTVRPHDGGANCRSWQSLHCKSFCRLS